MEFNEVIEQITFDLYKHEVRHAKIITPWCEVHITDVSRTYNSTRTYIYKDKKLITPEDEERQRAEFEDKLNILVRALGRIKTI